VDALAGVMESGAYRSAAYAERAYIT
jgi:hypothetical protein